VRSRRVPDAFPSRLVRSRVLPEFPSRLDAFPMSFPGCYITGRPVLVRSSRPSLPGSPPVLFSLLPRVSGCLSVLDCCSLVARSSRPSVTALFRLVSRCSPVDSSLCLSGFVALQFSIQCGELKNQPCNSHFL
jgi:hypothetical protein